MRTTRYKADLEFNRPAVRGVNAWIQKYLQSTGASYYNLKRVVCSGSTRHGEGRPGSRAHDSIVARKLLGTGTTSASSAVDLGNRPAAIMPPPALGRARRQGHLPRLRERPSRSRRRLGRHDLGAVPAEAARSARSTRILRDDSSLKERPQGLRLHRLSRPHRARPPARITITIDCKKSSCRRVSPSRFPSTARARSRRG